jgi:hypothetical protein
VTLKHEIGEFLVRSDLEPEVLRVLVQWWRDPKLCGWNAGATHLVVEGFIEQQDIAKNKYGKATVDTRNKQTNDRIEELNRLADEDEKIYAEFQRIEINGEFIFTIGRKEPVWPRLKLSLNERAAVHRESAVMLRAAARNYEPIPTKQMGGERWRHGQFMRGMIGVIDDAKWWNHRDPEPNSKIVESDYELVAQLASLVFGKTFTAKNARRAQDTTEEARKSKTRTVRKSRSGKTLK